MTSSSPTAETIYEVPLYLSQEGIDEIIMKLLEKDPTKRPKTANEVARSLEAPVQFVVGDSDPYVSASELGGFEVLELADTGHLANLERPDEFNAILLDFLARV